MCGKLFYFPLFELVVSMIYSAGSTMCHAATSTTHETLLHYFPRGCFLESPLPDLATFHTTHLRGSHICLSELGTKWGQEKARVCCETLGSPQVVKRDFTARLLRQVYYSTWTMGCCALGRHSNPSAIGVSQLSFASTPCFVSAA